MDAAGCSCNSRRVEPLALAWAAGLFDAEGTTVARSHARRPGYRQLQVSVPQRGRAGIPSVLIRFQRAVLGIGRIEGPTRAGVYTWRCADLEGAQAVLALLWSQLAPVKRQQASSAMRNVRAQYETGAYKARRSRRRGTPHALHPESFRTAIARDDLERAWAAGFLDGEGSFGLAGLRPRKNAAPWRRLRASACQHDDRGTPAEVLQRLRRALGGIGRLERHGEPGAFKWVTEGRAAVERVVAATSPWLGDVKVEQARRALAAFSEQERIRGDVDHCARGHAYDFVTVNLHRVHRRCNGCARIAARKRRAAQGIEPRQFKDVRRRYNF
jgi:hypothetical protein